MLNANLIKPSILYSPNTLGNSIKYNGKSLISHINASLNTNSNPKVWYESDITRNPLYLYSYIYSLYYGNGKYIAGGNSGKMTYSIDGVNWNEVADSAFGSSYMYSICYGNGKYVASGMNGRVIYSTDGINWTAVMNSTFGSPSYIYSICYGNGIYVAGSYNGKIAYYII